MKVAEARALLCDPDDRAAMLATVRQHQPFDELWRKLNKARRRSGRTQEALDYLARRARDRVAAGKPVQVLDAEHVQYLKL